MYTLPKLKNNNIISVKNHNFIFLSVRSWGREGDRTKSTFCTPVKMMKKMDNPLIL